MKADDCIDPQWTDEALDRLLAAVKAEPRVKNSKVKPVKEESS